MKLSKMALGQTLTGLEPSFICTVVAVTHISDVTVQVVYKLPDGSFRERLLGLDDEEDIALATVEQPQRLHIFRRLGNAS